MKKDFIIPQEIIYLDKTYVPHPIKNFTFFAIAALSPFGITFQHPIPMVGDDKTFILPKNYKKILAGLKGTSPSNFILPIDEWTWAIPFRPRKNAFGIVQIDSHFPIPAIAKNDTWTWEALIKLLPHDSPIKIRR